MQQKPAYPESGEQQNKIANGLKGMKSADVLRKITQKKMANGLTTTEGFMQKRIRIQIAVDVGDVVVVEVVVRTSL